MKTILSVVVGSRLHGLNNEKSDYDYRGIFLQELSEVFSPYKKPANTSWIEGDNDNTAYELRDFCKFATQGNATILEILYSDMIKTINPLGETLIKNRVKFLDSKRIYEAHKGYAANQYNKMGLFEPDQRTPKFAVAYMRVLLQAIKMLQFGNYDGWLTEQDRAFLLEVKYSFDPHYHVQELCKRFAELQVELADTFYSNQNNFEPDLKWIEEFCYYSYTYNMNRDLRYDE